MLLLVDFRQIFVDDGIVDYAEPAVVVGFVHLRGASVSIGVGVARGLVHLDIATPAAPRDAAPGEAQAARDTAREVRRTLLSDGQGPPAAPAVRAPDEYQRRSALPDARSAPATPPVPPLGTPS